MFEKEIKKYQALNTLAKPSGIVILGGTEDLNVPLCELKQAFALESPLYNRSIHELPAASAAEIYDACIAKLAPETLLLHIGAADLPHFTEAPADFDQQYRTLLKHIRTKAPKCTVVILSLRNPDEDPAIAELNKHLKYIAESEQREYGDIAAKRVWNPKETKDVVSFLYSTGFVRPLKTKRPVFDLIKILFCYEDAL